MLVVALAFGCSRTTDPVTETLPVYGFEVVASFPHDTRAFTQGLQFFDGHLYESTGLRGQSSLRKVEKTTGRVLRRVNLPTPYFGEGIAIVSNRIIMLTWQEQTGFIFDRETFARIGAFSYSGEGWGLAYDGERLIMSDGTPRLRFLDPDDLTVIGEQDITAAGEPLHRINELAWIEGELWANIFETERIARIDVERGVVTSWVDLTGLLKPEYVTGRVDVLNGIAYDPDTQRVFVTGKWWPRLFEIRLTP